MEQKNLSFNIGWGSLWRIFAMLIIGVVLYTSLNILLALFLAIIISAALHPLVTWLEKYGIPRIIGTLSIYILVIFFIALITYAIVPIALTEFSSVLSKTKNIPPELLDFAKATNIIEKLNQSVTDAANALFSGSSSLFDIVSRFFGNVSLALSVFILSFYLTVGKDAVERFLSAVLPAEYESVALVLYNRIRYKIGRWLEGQVFLSLVVGLMVFLGLWILGVPYSLLLGIIAGVLELVPFVGPIFSGALAILISLTDSGALAVYTFLLFAAIQQIENHILVPMVTKFTTSLDPVVVLVSLLIGVEVFGPIGLILSVPASVLVQEAVENWGVYKSRRRALGF